MARAAVFALTLALLLVVARAGSPITSSTANEKPDQSSKKDDGLMTEIPAAIAKQAAAGNAEGVTYVDTAQDTFFMADVKKAGWNAQKCPPGLNKELAGACTPKNCSKGGIAAKWKTAYLQKNKLGYELYVPGNPLTLLKANPASCCNTCAATPACTYWQYIPDITIDGKKGKGACYLIHDQIDFTCGEMTAQYSTETKPVPLQVRIGGECNPSAKILNDPHLVGAHGTHFDFNGRPDKAFCLLTDRDLHVNMLLRGYYDERTDNAALVVDGKAVHTWIKELGIVWTAKGVDHKIRIAARGGKQQERGDGFVKSIEIDGEAIPRMQVGDSVTSDGGLTIQFRALEKEGPFDVDYYLLTIDGLISLDLRLRVAHPKLQTPSDAEAHINVGIAELEHTDAIHGVLGQTYRDDHAQRAADFQKLIASLHRPISADSAEGQGFLDGTPRSYEASDVLAVDCAYTAYGRARQASAAPARQARCRDCPLGLLPTRLACPLGPPRLPVRPAAPARQARLGPCLRAAAPTRYARCRARPSGPPRALPLRRRACPFAAAAPARQARCRACPLGPLSRPPVRPAAGPAFAPLRLPVTPAAAPARQARRGPCLRAAVHARLPLPRLSAMPPAGPPLAPAVPAFCARRGPALATRHLSQ
ncbi:unnamed protein product [Closterium sp. Naga37s-1]|nr:unnamed protein product [Closterium sp. Naga37s-1]